MKYIADKDGHWVPVSEPLSSPAPYVQPDIAEFRSIDGAHISGRAQWREHLKRTGTIEMGHADIKAAERQWAKKKEAFNARLKRPVPKGEVRPADVPVVEARDYEMSRVNREVRNRLEGRPAPDRVTLIKMAMEEARRR